MADKENVRITRAVARKRAAGEALSPPTQNKKRVILGDISSNVLRDCPDPSLSVSQKQPQRIWRVNKVNDAVTAPTAVVAPNTPIMAAASEKKKEIDIGGDDPQMCQEYAADIYEYLHNMEVEAKRRPFPNYIEKMQNDMSANMRGVLVDWLVDVAEEYKLLPETLYMTVSYIDRYLSINPLNRQKLQLLGISCMLIASKYEEISPPQANQFCYITDNTYTKDEVVKMEADVLKSLKFEMGDPTTLTFLRRVTKAVLDKSEDQNLKLEFLSCYLSELSLLDYACVKFQQSLVAAAAIFLAKFTLNPDKNPWTPALEHHSGYKASQLRECVRSIHDLQLRRRGGSLAAMRDKYKDHKFKCVSTLLSPPEIPAGYFDDMERK